MILFLFCMFAAGHSGGPFIMAELIIAPFVGALDKEILLMLPIIALHITGFIAIRRSLNKLTLWVTILLSLVVIAATIMSRGALSLVIWTNGTFLVMAVIYVVRYLKQVKERKIEFNVKSDNLN
ncbi:cyanate permease [Mucilaginibacter sp. 3215]